MKKFIFLFFLVIFSLNILAQEDGFYGPSEPSTNDSKKEQRQKKLEKWSFGGNFWLSFGTNSYIEISPVVLYRLTPKLLIGPGFSYIYEKNSYWGYETSSYGPRAIIDYSLFTNLNELLKINIGNIVVHSEYEYLNVEKFYIDKLQGNIFSDGRTWINSCLIGGGIYQPIGSRGGGVSIIILFDIIENEFSRYSNPVWRLGFYF